MYTYKLIIADDESVIRKNLSDLLIKKIPVIETPVLCADGKQVIDILKKTNIDIIISDIRMPISSGLDIAKYVQENNLDTKIILISGFSEFEYAHKALQYGVKHFILKPIDFNEIISAVNEIIQTISEHIKQIHTNTLTEMHMREVSRRYLSLYLFGVIPFNKLSELDSSGMAIDLSRQCAIVDIKINNNDTENLINTYYNNMWIDICEICNDNIDCYCINESEESAKLLVITKDSDIAATEQNVKKHLEDCKRMMRGAYQKDFIYTVKFYNSLEEINLLDLEGLTDIYINHMIRLDNTSNEDMLRIIMISLPISNVHKFLHSVMRNLADNYAFLSERLAAQISSISDLEAIIEFSKSLNKEFNSNSNTNYVVNKVAIYINKHYGDQGLDLNFIANKFKFNRSYLSRVFKQQTGQNPSEYIYNIRMEESKRLLQSNKFTVKQVAEKVGYSDEGYFGQAFKKATGMTPSKFMRTREE